MYSIKFFQQCEKKVLLRLECVEGKMNACDGSYRGTFLCNSRQLASIESQVFTT